MGNFCLSNLDLAGRGTAAKRVELDATAGFGNDYNWRLEGT